MEEMSAKHVVGVGVTIFGVLLGLTVLLGSWYRIDIRERGLVLRNGAYEGVSDPGLHFKLPLVDTVAYFPTQQLVTSWTSDEMEAYSRDQQPANLTVTVNWSINPAKVREAYENYSSAQGAETIVIKSKVPKAIKEVFGQYSAASAIQERTQLNTQIEENVRNLVAKEDNGIINIDSVQVVDISFDKKYTDAVMERMQAEVEVQRLQQNAQREQVQAKIVVIQAQAKADAVVAQATADANAIKLRGNAEAEVIASRGKALEQNPNLILLTQAEKWNGILPTTMVPGGTVPFISVGQSTLAVPNPDTNKVDLKPADEPIVVQ